MRKKGGEVGDGRDWVAAGNVTCPGDSRSRKGYGSQKFRIKEKGPEVGRNDGRT